ncbi:hypothetical protein KFL_000630265 [Klebsormidium nitens]|uniref:Uncharacterized protein n=1 Tax=Klebsormidium nitens TaxID=105231 RepID=A0A1Y1HQB1_KLENI|nr:hypothetical protein KFL_000630265 [Klebsormidium nitens]|eukprot:GAQ80824.1 hypothetical protein KFL_000630265 [Klebsormidium nitens]
MAVRTAVLLLVLGVACSEARRPIEDIGSYAEPCDLYGAPYSCYEANGRNPVCCKSRFCQLAPDGRAECGPLCDPLSRAPGACFNNDKTKFVCCSFAHPCPANPGPEPTCFSIPVKTLHTQTLAPVHTHTMTLAPLHTQLLEPNPTPACDPSSGQPNQCFNRNLDASKCCPEACAADPGDLPACA